MEVGIRSKRTFIITCKFKFVVLSNTLYDINILCCTLNSIQTLFFQYYKEICSIQNIVRRVK